MLRKAAEHDDSRPGDSRSRWVTFAFAVIILTPSMIGFVMKFSEFMHTYRDDAEGAFAITPMVNYLLASLGFLCLLLWSAINSMAHRQGRPEEVMLQRELLLDENLANLQGARHGE